MLLLPFILIAAQNAASGTVPEPLPIGRVVDSVVCLHDSTQSYALYLPASYRSDRKWPILYAFDPMARGRVPVVLFREAAERLGYIVVGSNNSRNGPTEPVLKAIEAIWIDTHARFAIDPNRVYTTGMSGGTFSALVLGAQKAAGVVACAGALNADRLNCDTTVDWLGIAGVADFNYTRNKAMVRALVERGVVARFETFEGGHGWPPEDVAARALEWLEISAMRKGTRPADPAFVDKYHERGVMRASAARKNGSFDDAAEEYAALARELRGLRSIEDLESGARRLHETREARKNREHEAKLDKKDREQTQSLFMLLQALQRPDMLMPSDVAPIPRASLAESSDVSPSSIESQDIFSLHDAHASARRELRNRIQRLRRDCESSKADRAVVARRVIDGFRISALYDGINQLSQGNPKAAKVAFEFCAEAQPENAYFKYELARAYAALRDKKKALAELRHAVEGGFSDGERLTNDAEWESVRKEPAYLEIVNHLKQKPKIVDR
jgi:hypothetical protein